MESTSSSEDNILETCIIDSSDLESAETEIDGPSQSKNTEELAGTTDSLSRIEGGYESEKTDKNEDVDDGSNEKCASDNEIEYYKSDAKRYNEHERNDSEDNDMIEMHSTPEISYHLNDPINTEVAKKSHGVPSDQECLLMGPCPEDPKKMENLVNTTPKEKDEKKEELNSCEMVKEKELDEKKQENAVTANDNGDKNMEDGTEMVEEQKEFFHNEGKADENDISGEKEDVDDDKEISDDSYNEENDEPRETVDDAELVDNKSLDDQGIAEQDNESVFFDFKELIAAVNGDVDHDVVRNVNIIDPGLPNYNKKIFIDDIVRDERSKNIIEEVENRLCGKSDKECETEKYVGKEHENVTHGNTEVQQNESKKEHEDELEHVAMEGDENEDVLGANNTNDIENEHENVLTDVEDGVEDSNINSGDLNELDDEEHGNSVEMEYKMNTEEVLEARSDQDLTNSSHHEELEHEETEEILTGQNVHDVPSEEECLPEKVRETSSAAAMIGFDRFIEDDEDFNPPDIPDELFEGYENEGSDFFISMSKDEKIESSDQNSDEKSHGQSVVAVDDQKIEEDEIIEQQTGPIESNSREHLDDDWQLVYKQRESLKKDEQLDRRIDDEQISFDQIEDHVGLEAPLNSKDKMKDHVFKEASFYNAKGESKKVITNNEIIDEVPNDLWSEEDDELAYTFEKLHIQGTAEGFMAEEMSNANKKTTIFADQSQDLKKVSVANEDKTVESDQISDSFARVYERGMHTSAEAFRSRMVNDVFSKIADKNAPPEEKALEDLIRKQRTIEDRIRVEDTIERLKNADNSKILHSEMDKPVNPFIPTIKNKPRSNFVPKVNISFSPHKKGVKLAFLKNKLLVITTVKQCRVNAVNEKIENVKYVERFYKIRSNQRVDTITKAEIKQKATNTAVRHNIYALLLDVGSFKRTGVRMSNDPGLNETMMLSFKDKLAATMRCIEQKDYAMAFLLSKGNREAEQAAIDAYLQNFVDPLFHCFFCSTAENVRPYHTEPYPRDDGRWAEVLSLLLEKKNVSDYDMENLLKIRKARGEQFYVLVLLYLKFGKSFFHRYKDVLLTNYEFMRIMNYLKIKDVEDLKAYYEEYFMVTDKELPVTSGGWGWKNYVEKGISKIIGIDSTFMENETPKEPSKRDENEQNKTVAESKSHSDEKLNAKRKTDHQIKDGSESNTLLAKEALFEKHIKLAKEDMERTGEKAVPDYASSFADFFVSEPLLVPDTSYDDQSLPKSVIDRDKDDENDVIIAKKEEKGWGFSLLNLFKRKEKRYKVKCNVECDFKYDPQTKRWVNTKAQATKTEKIDSKKDAAVPEKNVPLPCPVTRKAGTKKAGDSIASRYVIGNSAADGDEVNANDIFGVCKKK